MVDTKAPPDGPIDNPSHLNTIISPSNWMAFKTSIEMDDAGYHYHMLYDLYEWPDISQAGTVMVHGRIKWMEDWSCRASSGRVVKMPTRAFRPWQPLYNASGKCAICGKDSDERYPGPLIKVKPGGKEHVYNLGGYCHPCHLNVQRWHNWHRLRRETEKKMVLSRQYGLYERYVVHKLLGKFRMFQPEYVDKRKIGDDHVYRVPHDWKHPRDYVNRYQKNDIAESLERLAMRVRSLP